MTTNLQSSVDTLPHSFTLDATYSIHNYAHSHSFAVLYLVLVIRHVALKACSNLTVPGASVRVTLSSGRAGTCTIGIEGGGGGGGGGGGTGSFLAELGIGGWKEGNFWCLCWGDLEFWQSLCISIYIKFWWWLGWRGESVWVISRECMVPAFTCDLEFGHRHLFSC